MSYITTFKRYEIKYLLTLKEKEELLTAISPYMKLDDYGRTTIRNIYFDTPSHLLIRRSIEKPVYKEKLRLRSYKTTVPGDDIFVELKMKFKSVVYKRRLVLPAEQVMESFNKALPLPVNSQIADEINYFRTYYENLIPAVFLSYEREAFYDLCGGSFRVTFDENILYRCSNFTFSAEPFGKSVLKDGYTVMEIKTDGGMPLWMSSELNRLGLYKASFSKYGTAYLDMTKNQSNQNTRRLQYA